MQNIVAIVMAGGKGSRMNSKRPKVLYEIGGEAMIFHTLRNLHEIGIKDIFTVVSYKAEEVKEVLKQRYQESETSSEILRFSQNDKGGAHRDAGGTKGDKRIFFAHQLEPLGTGDAVKSALGQMEKAYETVLVVGGDDSAFYTPGTLLELINSHQDSEAVISMMTLVDPEKERMGKVFRNAEGEFDKLLEYTDYSVLGMTSSEVNCGVYLFEYDWLKKNIDKLEKNPIKGEYYLTELMNMAKKQDKKINIFVLKNKDEWFGVNTPEELEEANRLYKNLMSNV